MITSMVRGFFYSCDVMFSSLRSSQKVQKFFEWVYFTFGFIGVYQILKVHYFKNRSVQKIYEELGPQERKAWIIADFLGNLSWILAALKSQPAIAIGKWCIQHLTSQRQLERFLGNQYQLRGELVYNTIGILAFVLGVPTTLKTLYRIYKWIKVKPQPKPAPDRKIPMVDLALTLKTANRISQTAVHIISSTGRPF